MLLGAIYFVDPVTGEERFLGRHSFSNGLTPQSIFNELEDLFWDPRLTSADCKKRFVIQKQEEEDENTQGFSKQ